MQRDFQATRNYDWEKKACATDYRTYLTDYEVLDLVRQICIDYKLEIFPKVRTGKGGFAWGRANCISLPSWAKNKMTVVHEMAHVVFFQKMKDYHKYAGHGPEYIRLLLNMYAKYLGKDLEELERSARLAGLVYSTQEKVPQPTGEYQKILSDRVKTLEESLSILPAEMLPIIQQSLEIARKELDSYAA